MKSSFGSGRVALTMLFVALLGGCTMDAVQMNRKAQIYYEAGKYAEAEKLLVNSMDIDHENPASRYWLGRCYEAMSEPEKAIYEYSMAVRYDPTLEAAQVSMIRMLHERDQDDKALEAARNYLNHNPAPAREMIRLAEKFQTEGLEPEAILAYDSAQEVEPTNPQPSLIVADYYFAKGERDKGVQALIRALKADPYYPGLARRIGEYGYRVEVPEPAGRSAPAPAQPSELEQKLRQLEQ